MFAALQFLKKNGGQAPAKEVIDYLSTTLTFSDWESSKYEKTGYVRWQSILTFYSINCAKAGFLLKKKGVWYLTPEGEKALDLGEIKLFHTMNAAYKDWRVANPKIQTTEEEVDEISNEAVEVTLEDMEVRASDGIKKYIDSINAYEFQDLVAALLRGMGYHTPFIAPKGKDGGIDVIAYRDPLGTVIPRIKVQVKHRENSASAGEVRQLIGILQKDGDVGLFVSTGGFSPDAKGVARGASIHVELIDLDRFIELWQEFYHKLSDEDKNRLPLLPIYFLAPSK
jgi:restriction system protein